MHEDAIGPLAGLPALDEHGGLEIEHGDGIEMDVGGIEQVPVGRNRNITNEAEALVSQIRDSDHVAARLQVAGLGSELELIHASLGAAPRIHACSGWRKSQAVPGVA